METAWDCFDGSFKKYAATNAMEENFDLNRFEIIAHNQWTVERERVGSQVCRYGRGFSSAVLSAFVRTFAPPRWRPEKGLPARLHLSDCRNRMRPTPGKVCPLTSSPAHPRRRIRSPYPPLSPAAAYTRPRSACHLARMPRSFCAMLAFLRGEARGWGGQKAAHRPATSRRGGRGEVRWGGGGPQATGAAGRALRSSPAGQALPRERGEGLSGAERGRGVS